MFILPINYKQLDTGSNQTAGIQPVCAESKEGNNRPDVVFLKGKECAFLGRRARVAYEARQLRGSSCTKRLGLMAVVNRQVKGIQALKPINLCWGGYGEGQKYVQIIQSN